MARAEAVKLYRTFVKGLISEASPLTYPEDSSIAEDNCVIYRTGNRSRRLGIDLESTTGGDTLVGSFSDIGTRAFQSYRWDSVANDATKTFICVQAGFQIRFFDGNATDLTGGEYAFSVDLNAFKVASATNHVSCQVSFAAGRGILYVVGEKFEPFYVQYNSTTNNITTTRLYIQIRDFEGAPDNLANDEEPVALSAEHQYNLMNQGWLASENAGSGNSVSYFNSQGGLSSYNQPAATPITSYQSVVGRYPANNKQWWVAKDSTAVFDPSLLQKSYFGTTLAPRGHYVVDAFNIDRSVMSGVGGLPIISSVTRPYAVTFAHGRVWYGSNSTLYFSQLLDDKNKAGKCHQEADPTSEDISDLLATDGGVIPIPEMAKVLRLVPVGSGVVAFSTNGVWFVSGTSAGFTATDISVSKISPTGTTSPNAIVEVNDSIYWWSDTGIMALGQKMGAFGPVEGIFENQNIAEQTIQTFYNDISATSKQNAVAVYDPQTNIIQWLYKEHDDVDQNIFYNKVLNLDLTLQAFYPWTISWENRESNSALPYVIGVFTTPVLAGHNGTATNITVRKTFIKYLCLRPDYPNYRLGVAQFSDANFEDWASWNALTSGDALPYTSYVETGYELLEDALRKKQTPHIKTYFKKTEENYVDDGAGDYTSDRKSSCYFQVKWNWSNSQISNKWSSKVQAYRHRRVPVVNVSDLTYDSGYPVVVTQHKVRGSGTAIQFRFECSEIDRDFDILGWSVNFVGNTKV